MRENVPLAVVLAGGFDANMKTETMSIDLETKSAADIGKTGVYRYAEDPDFDILLFGVSVSGGPVTVYDLASGENLPVPILEAEKDADVQHICKQMGRTPAWIPALVLRADGYECEY